MQQVFYGRNRAESAQREYAASQDQMNASYLNLVKQIQNLPSEVDIQPSSKEMNPDKPRFNSQISRDTRMQIVQKTFLNPQYFLPQKRGLSPSKTGDRSRQYGITLINDCETDTTLQILNFERRRKNRDTEIINSYFDNSNRLHNITQNYIKQHSLMQYSNLDKQLHNNLNNSQQLQINGNQPINTKGDVSFNFQSRSILQNQGNDSHHNQASLTSGSILPSFQSNNDSHNKILSYGNSILKNSTFHEKNSQPVRDSGINNSKGALDRNSFNLNESNRQFLDSSFQDDSQLPQKQQHVRSYSINDDLNQYSKEESAADMLQSSTNQHNIKSILSSQNYAFNTQSIMTEKSKLTIQPFEKSSSTVDESINGNQLNTSTSQNHNLSLQILSSNNQIINDQNSQLYKRAKPTNQDIVNLINSDLNSRYMDVVAIHSPRKLTTTGVIDNESISNLNISITNGNEDPNNMRTLLPMIEEGEEYGSITKLQLQNRGQLATNNNSKYINHITTSTDLNTRTLESSPIRNRTILPDNYEKRHRLGRGTYSSVYQFLNQLDTKLYAGKLTVLTEQSKRAFDNELEVYRLFFHQGGEIKQPYQNQPGVYQIPAFHCSELSETDAAILVEVGGKMISKALFQFRKETLKGEPIFQVYPKKLHQSFGQNVNSLQELFIDLAQAVALLSDNQICHSDIRMENILVQTINYGDCQVISETQLIDFGSSFNVNLISGVSHIIPEYMPPELLVYLMGNENIPFCYKEAPWTIDMWSLGCVMLEILTSIPLWMPYRCSIHQDSSNRISSGLFAVQDRKIEKIYQKQIKLVQNIKTSLPKSNYQIPIDDVLESALHGLLQFNPVQRLSPHQLIDLLQSVPQK